MINKYIVAIVLILSFSCNGQVPVSENNELSNAKWNYYSYAVGLTAYDKSNKPINPLLCDISLTRSIKIGSDTTEMYFNAFYKDMLNQCSFKPYGLTGIMIIRDKFYLPIYHSIIFESQKESEIYEEMQRRQAILKEEITKSKGDINQWIYDEARRRKLF